MNLLSAQGMLMGLRMAKRLGLESKPVSQIQKVAYDKEHSQDTFTEYVTTRIQLGSHWKDLNFYLADIGDLAFFLASVFYYFKPCELRRRQLNYEILLFEKVMLSCQVQSWVGIEPTTSHDEGWSCYPLG